MNEPALTREEVVKYIGTLPEGTQITFCRSKEEVPANVRLVAETVKTEKGAWISFLRSAQGLIVAVWVFANALWPDYIPEVSPKIVAASALASALDIRFPFAQNLGQPPVYVPNYLPSGSAIQGTGYYIPATGFATGSLSLG